MKEVLSWLKNTELEKYIKYAKKYKIRSLKAEE